MNVRENRPLDDYRDLIPSDETGFATAGMRILSYIDGDGAPSIAYECQGSDELLDWLGVLEWVKLQMFDRRYDRGNDDDA